MTFKWDPLASAIPITLVTGFLGSGKTTLVNALLSNPEMNRSAVIVNEIGEIGIDDALISMFAETVSLLANGCLCCSVRADLQSTLRDLYERRRVGEIPQFDRVLIETTGLADPAPIIQTLSTDSFVSSKFRLDAVVSTVSATTGADLFDREIDSARQVAMSDVVLITKSDMSGRERVQELQDRICEITPYASVRETIKGAISPKELVGIGLNSAITDRVSNRFFQALQLLPPHSAPAGKGGESEHDVAPGPSRTRQDGIGTFSLMFEDPFSLSEFWTAIEVPSRSW